MHDIIKAPRIGKKASQPYNPTYPHGVVVALFDGKHFALWGDGKQVLQAEAQSGKPLKVRKKDAENCKGSEDDTYMNNPRYVGIQDFGAIPEGKYKFRVNQMSIFSSREQARMLLGGSFIDPFGRTMHGGDWGAGRVPLRVIQIEPSKYGGNTSARSGFYLHGGIMSGSAGCIDVGDNYDDIVDLLKGYQGWITVVVKYIYSAPSVGLIRRALGRFTYPEEAEPSIWDRVRSLMDM